MYERKDISKKINTQFLNENPDVSGVASSKAARRDFIAKYKQMVAANKREAASLEKEIKAGKATPSDEKRLARLYEIIKNQTESIARETDRLSLGR